MTDSQKAPAEREYEKSGFYPANDKPFRIWALLAWLGGSIVFLAAVSALLNFILI